MTRCGTRNFTSRYAGGAGRSEGENNGAALGILLGTKLGYSEALNPGN
jgi:hypothetical protein